MDGSTPELTLKLQSVQADGAPMDGAWCATCAPAGCAAIIDAGGRIE